MKKSLLVTAATLLFASTTFADANACGGGMYGKGGDNGCGYGMQQGQGRNMESRLGLSAEQSQKLAQLRSDHFNSMLTEKRKLAALEKELWTESMVATPDKNKMEQLTAQIGTQNTALSSLKSNHMLAVAALLTPEQRTMMQSMGMGMGMGMGKMHGKGGYGMSGQGSCR